MAPLSQSFKIISRIASSRLLIVCSSENQGECNKIGEVILLADIEEFEMKELDYRDLNRKRKNQFLYFSTY